MGRFGAAAIAGAIAGDLAITIFLVVERALRAHLPLETCLLQLLQWDASNAYGASAFRGGWRAAAVGQGFDLVVSLCWAAAFTALYAAVPIVRRHTWPWGLGYGIVVMTVMLYGLVPLGHATRMHDDLANVLRTLVAHTVFFGVPVALAVRATMRSSDVRRDPRSCS